MAQALDPIRLFEQLKQVQQAVFRCAVDGNPFVSQPSSLPMRVFAVEQCTTGLIAAEVSVPDRSGGLSVLYQEQEKRKRALGWRRTHNDPFEGEWERITSWLQVNPEREPRRHLPGMTLSLSRTLSAIPNSHVAARDAENPSNPSGSRSGGVAGGSDPWMIARSHRTREAGTGG